MTDANEFNTESPDSQGTQVSPVSPDRFDYDAYADYEAGLLER